MAKFLKLILSHSGGGGGHVGASGLYNLPVTSPKSPHRSAEHSRDAHVSLVAEVSVPCLAH